MSNCFDYLRYIILGKHLGTLEIWWMSTKLCWLN